ncbi:phage terminase small subunit P27 family [Schleiferilactobacillus perolens]|uniref:phage terminase small subunit P27 family n=1 Tax=Schleiferilactobacillus perolens TaxID=100468 RepID=UPI002357B538|nr:phage terminase small subunit P27 family [Schleiferilactobacillus perolens]MCI2170981.1 phage terminase small subunit P27 family [Schleiferilactobacillus perolens]
MANRYKNVEDIRGHMPPKVKAERQQAQEAMFQFKELTTQPPAWLDDMAIVEWRRIVPLLKDDIPVSELDVAMIASYCQSYADVQHAQEDIKENGPVFIADNGNMRQNPSVGIKQRATAELMKLADSLGLSVYGRLKMNIKGEVKKPADPFAKVLER